MFDRIYVMNNWVVTWYFQQCGMCDQQSLRSACAYAQSDQSLYWSLEYSMSVKLPTKHHLEFLSLIVGCTVSSKSTLPKMPHCWKSHVTAQIWTKFNIFQNLEQLILISIILPYKHEDPTLSGWLFRNGRGLHLPWLTSNAFLEQEKEIESD